MQLTMRELSLPGVALHEWPSLALPLAGREVRGKHGAKAVPAFRERLMGPLVSDIL